MIESPEDFACRGGQESNAYKVAVRHRVAIADRSLSKDHATRRGFNLLGGGFDIRGESWGRATDTICIGYAFLDGGNGDVRKTQVLEAYYRFVFNEHVALTADLQYLDDKLARGGGPEGYILGLRATAEF